MLDSTFSHIVNDTCCFRIGQKVQGKAIGQGHSQQKGPRIRPQASADPHFWMFPICGLTHYKHETNQGCHQSKHLKITRHTRGRFLRLLLQEWEGFHAQLQVNIGIISLFFPKRGIQEYKGTLEIYKESQRSFLHSILPWSHFHSKGEKDCIIPHMVGMHLGTFSPVLKSLGESKVKTYLSLDYLFPTWYLLLHIWQS